MIHVDRLETALKACPWLLNKDLHLQTAASGAAQEVQWFGIITLSEERLPAM